MANEETTPSEQQPEEGVEMNVEQQNNAGADAKIAQLSRDVTKLIEQGLHIQSEAPSYLYTKLADLKIQPVRRWAYGDHHRYRPHEIRRLALHGRAAGVEVLLTTQKDVQNLPPDAATLASPLEIWWLEIGLEVENESELLALVRRLTDAR